MTTIQILGNTALLEMENCQHNEVEQEQVEDLQTGFLTWETFCKACGAFYNDLDDIWVEL